ncbi:MAG TPA: ribbon-helix-helix domain-containing protein [Saliniramus sp.]|nr:ribbon-helix-helix domain-containing protein [Saliniramus sp.]
MSDATSNGVIKRSISIAGHRTSISLEEPFWEELQQIAARRGVSVQRLVGEIDESRAGENLSSALRVFVLREVQARAADLLRAAHSVPDQAPGSHAVSGSSG